MPAKRLIKKKIPLATIKKKVKLSTRKKMALAQKKRYSSIIKAPARFNALIKKIKASKK